MMIPIYAVISRLFLIRKLDLLGGVDSGGDLGGLAIWREMHVGSVWLIGFDAQRQTLLVSCCLDVW
jgi:hypothetical protein